MKAERKQPYHPWSIGITCGRWERQTPAAPRPMLGRFQSVATRPPKYSMSRSRNRCRDHEAGERPRVRHRSHLVWPRAATRRLAAASSWAGLNASSPASSRSAMINDLSRLISTSSAAPRSRRIVSTRPSGNTVTDSPFSRRIVCEGSSAGRKNLRTGMRYGYAVLKFAPLPNRGAIRRIVAPDTVLGIPLESFKPTSRRKPVRSKTDPRPAVETSGSRRRKLPPRETASRSRPSGRIDTPRGASAQALQAVPELQTPRRDDAHSVSSLRAYRYPSRCIRAGSSGGSRVANSPSGRRHSASAVERRSTCHVSKRIFAGSSSGFPLRKVLTLRGPFHVARGAFPLRTRQFLPEPKSPTGHHPHAP